MTPDQAAELMGITSRHARRILATYGERGAAALAHGHRGRRPVNATPEALIADVAHLARTRYAGVNHTHLAELLAEPPWTRHRRRSMGLCPGSTGASEFHDSAPSQRSGPWTRSCAWNRSCVLSAAGR